MAQNVQKSNSIKPKKATAQTWTGFRTMAQANLFIEIMLSPETFDYLVERGIDRDHVRIMADTYRVTKPQEMLMETALGSDHVMGVQQVADTLGANTMGQLDLDMGQQSAQKAHSGTNVSVI